MAIKTFWGATSSLAVPVIIDSGARTAFKPVSGKVIVAVGGTMSEVIVVPCPSGMFDSRYPNSAFAALSVDRLTIQYFFPLISWFWKVGSRLTVQVLLSALEVV